MHTGALTSVVGNDVVLMAELGDAHVLDRAVAKLTGGFPVPDEGVHQVLAVVVLTLVAEASDVEIGLGDAVADAERLVFSTARHGNPLEEIYDLKREIAEARRALSPVTSVLPELMAEAEEGPGRRRSQPWLRRAEAWVDRLDKHLDGYDDLLSDMLSVHLCAGVGAAERGRPQDLVVGGHRGRAHPRRQHLRHELRAHAGADVDVRLPAWRSPRWVPSATRSTGCSAGPAGSEPYVVTGALLASSTPVSSRSTTSAASPSR